ncbi:hypothetical protein MLD38_025490 [Melastoma candidum]|uniref:Uncharacterized protein n=1 Tax=Melastoma candidum TaxID=119954 RepID=A0ACB9NWH4_9MYRT|nr:hypothetical protein MLD38_025490 [Melastoma candidum]
MEYFISIRRLGFHVSILLSILSATCVLAEDHAATPPRGWNSYDSYGWIISEEDFLANAEAVAQKLSGSGYEYVVVDYLWYRKRQPGVTMHSRGFDNIDFWGRVVPDPDRWPSCRNGKGFTDIAQKVHDMGLKFGIHVMRGISTQAFDANSPIHDSIKGGAYIEGGRQCLGAGRAFLRSLYSQYRDWGVDFVKHDCVFGDDFSLDEITYVSQVLAELDRPIIYSLSPGTHVTPEKARQINGLVNMYRITADDWDTWGDVEAHFDVTRDLNVAGLTGAAGLMGKSWPDLDMLPLGWLTDPEAGEGPHRQTRLTLDEQKTQMTLWAMAKSPLMFGGDMKNLDDTTLGIITNPTVLNINSFSSNNKEVMLTFGSRLTRHGNGRRMLSIKYPELIGDEGYKPDFALTTCGDLNAYGWTVEANDEHFDKICWKDGAFCLYRRNSSTPADNGAPFLLSASRSDEFCLDASSRKKLTAGETKSSSFSTCEGSANQMWEYHGNGTLVSSYSGLCAVVKKPESPFQPAAKSLTEGVREWIATGADGPISEVYAAFFNLNEVGIYIEAKVSDITGVLPAEFHRDTSDVMDEWGNRYWAKQTKVSAEIGPHGCALLVLRDPPQH